MKAKILYLEVEDLDKPFSVVGWRFKAIMFNGTEEEWDNHPNEKAKFRYTCSLDVSGLILYNEEEADKEIPLFYERKEEKDAKAPTLTEEKGDGRTFHDSSWWLVVVSGKKWPIRIEVPEDYERSLEPKAVIGYIHREVTKLSKAGIIPSSIVFKTAKLPIKVRVNGSPQADSYYDGINEREIINNSEFSPLGLGIDEYRFTLVDGEAHFDTKLGSGA